jgi:hypothetical protein
VSHTAHTATMSALAALFGGEGEETLEDVKTLMPTAHPYTFIIHCSNIHSLSPARDMRTDLKVGELSDGAGTSRPPGNHTYTYLFDYFILITQTERQRYGN